MQVSSQAELLDGKYAANEALDKMFDSIERFTTYKMVNEVNEILDHRKG